MARNRVIGRDNRLPWRLPDEMRHFVDTTRGKPVIMGRKQWQSLAKPLAKRTNIVLSGDPEFRAPGAIVVRDLDAAMDAALKAASASGADEACVIGGAEIYRLALPRADRLYFTLIDAEIDGDAFFPTFDESEWREVSRQAHARDARHAYPYTIRVLERRKP